MSKFHPAVETELNSIIARGDAVETMRVLRSSIEQRERALDRRLTELHRQHVIGELAVLRAARAGLRV